MRPSDGLLAVANTTSTPACLASNQAHIFVGDGINGPCNQFFVASIDVAVDSTLFACHDIACTGEMFLVSSVQQLRLWHLVMVESPGSVRVIGTFQQTRPADVRWDGAVLASKEQSSSLEAPGYK